MQNWMLIYTPPLIQARKQQSKTVWQSMKLLLFNASSGMVSCPLAMTAGAAATLSVLLDTTETSSSCSKGVGSQAWRDELQETVEHLTSREPAQFWTSGRCFLCTGPGRVVYSLYHAFCKNIIVLLHEF